MSLLSDLQNIRQYKDEQRNQQLVSGAQGVSSIIQSVIQAIRQHAQSSQADQQWQGAYPKSMVPGQEYWGGQAQIPQDVQQSADELNNLPQTEATQGRPSPTPMGQGAMGLPPPEDIQRQPSTREVQPTPASFPMVQTQTQVTSQTPDMQTVLGFLTSGNPFLRQKAQQYLAGAQVAQTLQKPTDEYTLKEGERRFRNGVEIASVPGKKELPGGFAQMSPEQQAKTFNETYGTSLTEDSFKQPQEKNPDWKPADHNGTNEYYDVVKKAWTGVQVPKTSKTGTWQKLTDPMGRITGWYNLQTQETMKPEDIGLKPEDMNAPLSNTTKTMVETAPKVQSLVDRIRPMIDKVNGELGPVAGRWNQFMTSGVGVKNPEYNKLRVDVGLLSTLLMRMHVGARGSEKIMEKFDNLIALGRQDPENLKAAMDEISSYANNVASAGNANHTIPPPKSAGKFQVLKVE